MPSTPSEPTSGLAALKGLIFLAILGFSLWYFWGGGVEASVAKDQIAQYEIAKRAGDTMQICVEAGIVTAAFLQAKDEVQYRTWMIQQRRLCCCWPDSMITVAIADSSQEITNNKT